MTGTVFLAVGAAACCIAAIRRQSGARIFLWLGLWSGMYGALHLGQSQALTAVLPHWLAIGAPYGNTALSYLLVVFGALSFLELSRDRVRFLIKSAAAVGAVIAVAGLASFIVTGSSSPWMEYNNALGAILLLVLTVVLAVPRLARKYLALSDRGVMAAGTFVFAVEALYNNLSHSLGYASPRILDHLGFAILLFSFGYVALDLVLANEHRLLSLDKELVIARQIQSSILPGCAPELKHTRIAAAYRPMEAVAGDFYEFIPVDPDRAGFLVADVSGHGIPAALIASMIKVAVQTVIGCADDPAALMRGLNRVLSGQLRGQLVSAAYLWLDIENREARYSAAGHPPLLVWRNGHLEKIESNGLLFGVAAAFNNYPVCRMPIAPGDRFLLYTDGVTEPENPDGEAFGDARLEQVLRSAKSCAPADLSDRLLSEIHRWSSMSQQDDITLIVIDMIFGQPEST